MYHPQQRYSPLMSCNPHDLWRDYVVCLLQTQQDPEQFDWWASIWIPVILASASIAVAIASVVTASKATGIAKRSETARVESEAKRSADESARHRADLDERYRERLDDAIVRLFQAIATQIGPLMEWSEKAEYVEIHNHTNDYGELDYPPDPPISEMLACCDAIRLLARPGEDARLAEALGHAMVVTERISGLQRRNTLYALVGELRDWRNGATSSEKATKFFLKIEENLRPQ